MHAGDSALLATVIGAVNTWRSDANGVGVDLNQINFIFPDGKPVIFAWDAEASDWSIDT